MLLSLCAICLTATSFTTNSTESEGMYPLKVGWTIYGGGSVSISLNGIYVVFGATGQDYTIEWVEENTPINPDGYFTSDAGWEYFWGDIWYDETDGEVKALGIFEQQ